MIDIQKDTAVEGEEIEVNCTAMASKPATTIRWFKGNKELKGKMRTILYRNRILLDSSK
jgi:cytotoxic regulatory T-cell molecule